MRYVGWALIGKTFLAVWGRGNVPDADFPEVLNAFRKLDVNNVRMLVVTEGGGPTPVQRKQMNDVLNGKELMTAVVTDDLVIRGTVTALSWFNKKIRYFPSHSLADAIEYLEVPEHQVDLVMKEVSVLRSQLGKPKLKS